jgi:hypothetical protein
MTRLGSRVVKACRGDIQRSRGKAVVAGSCSRRATLLTRAVSLCVGNEWPRGADTSHSTRLFHPAPSREPREDRDQVRRLARALRENGQSARHFRATLYPAHKRAGPGYAERRRERYVGAGDWLVFGRLRQILLRWQRRLPARPQASLFSAQSFTRAGGRFRTLTRPSSSGLQMGGIAPIQPLTPTYNLARSVASAFTSAVAPTPLASA